MRQVDLAIASTATRMVSLTTKVTTIDATLSSVEDSTIRMSKLFATNSSQLQRLRENETTQATIIQEHHDRLDNMDAILGRVYKSVMKTVTLTKELDTKFSDVQLIATNPPGHSLMSPGRTSDHDMTTVPPPDSTHPAKQADDTTAGKHPPPLAPLAPHRFAHVCLGPGSFMSQRASSYPLGNRPLPTDRPPPVKLHQA